jgi:hypothetical protein
MPIKLDKNCCATFLFFVAQQTGTMALSSNSQTPLAACLCEPGNKQWVMTEIAVIPHEQT